MADEELLASVQLHIQAQEEIKQELLATIRSLERELRPPRATLKLVHFHAATLRHIVNEKSAVMDQIANFKCSTLPDLQRQLDGARQKRELLESRIAALKKHRSEALMADLDNPAKVHASVAEFTASVLAEVQELTAEEVKMKLQTAQAKAELRVLQDQFLNRQRERSKQVMADEISEERDVLSGRPQGRRRSRTALASLPPVGRDRRMSLVKGAYRF
jgi:hypothetical protein